MSTFKFPNADLCEDCLRKVVESHTDLHRDPLYFVSHTNGHVMLCRTNRRDIAKEAIAKHLKNNPFKRITQYKVEERNGMKQYALDFFTSKELTWIENYLDRETTHGKEWQLQDFNHTWGKTA